MMLRIWPIGVFLCLFFWKSSVALEGGIQGHKAILGALDKSTARVEEFSLSLGATVRFGRIDITLHHCERNPPTRPPESVAFLEIIEEDFNGEYGRIFNGWMFASTPTLNGLDHPLYDIWVLECVADF